MIKQKRRELYRHEIEDIIRDNDAKTASDTLDILFGTHYDDYYTDYVVKPRFAPSESSNFVQRINRLWAYPLFLLTIPFQYVVLGRHGVSSDSKMGKLIEFISGPLK